MYLVGGRVEGEVDSCLFGCSWSAFLPVPQRSLYHSAPYWFFGARCAFPTGFSLYWWQVSSNPPFPKHVEPQAFHIPVLQASVTAPVPILGTAEWLEKGTGVEGVALATCFWGKKKISVWRTHLLRAMGNFPHGFWTRIYPAGSNFISMKIMDLSSSVMWLTNTEHWCGRSSLCVSILRSV